MSIKLSELGFIPYIIGTQWNNYNISFIKSKTNCIVINNSFKEIKEQDYDILMVNSDQTWRRFDEHYFDYGFLRFAEKWNKQKFVYGASLGYEFFNFEKKDINIIKRLLRQFSEISVREKNCIKWIEKHLGMKPFFVLDPTFLINKEYYLNLIKNYKSNKNINSSFIFTYLLRKDKYIKKFIDKTCKELGYKRYNVDTIDNNAIEEFIHGIKNCKAVITNSYHGTIFSIIFQKPFISFIVKDDYRERAISLREIFHLENRIIQLNQIPNKNMLNVPLDINMTLLNMLKNESINYLKKNLGLIKH